MIFIFTAIEQMGNDRRMTCIATMRCRLDMRPEVMKMTGIWFKRFRGKYHERTKKCQEPFVEGSSDGLAEVEDLIDDKKDFMIMKRKWLGKL